jgi:transcriptional regulator GlxA family with amidase domain
VRIDLVVFDGLDELDALGPLEVLRSAVRAGADLDVRLVTRTEQSTVTGANGLTFAPDQAYVAGEAEVLIVAGGGWATRAELGVFGELQRGEWLPLLVEARHLVRVMAGVCTGTLLLAAAGLTAGRRAGTHHAAWDDLASYGTVVVRDRVVDDGDLVTSGGVTSGIDLALWLLEREVSVEVASTVATRMEYRPTGPAST